MSLLDESEAVQRAAVVAEARRWIGTPYVDQGDIPKGGVDCGMLLVRTFVDTGLVEPFDPRPYSSSFFLHNDKEEYLEIIYACGGREIEGPPQPGDLAVWRVGRLYAHGAIVTEWPMVVHAFKKARMVTETDSSLQGMFQAGPKRFFSYWKAPK